MIRDQALPGSTGLGEQCTHRRSLPSLPIFVDFIVAPRRRPRHGPFDASATTLLLSISQYSPRRVIHHSFEARITGTVFPDWNLRAINFARRRLSVGELVCFPIALRVVRVSVESIPLNLVARSSLCFVVSGRNEYGMGVEKRNFNPDTAVSFLFRNVHFSIHLCHILAFVRHATGEWKTAQSLSN